MKWKGADKFPPDKNPASAHAVTTRLETRAGAIERAKHRAHIRRRSNNLSLTYVGESVGQKHLFQIRLRRIRRKDRRLKNTKDFLDLQDNSAGDSISDCILSAYLKRLRRSFDWLSFDTPRNFRFRIASNLTLERHGVAFHGARVVTEPRHEFGWSFYDRRCIFGQF